MRQQEETHIMENIIYNELLSRGCIVDVGMVEIKKQDKDGKWIRIQLEVDFIANLGSKKYYIQSALSIPDREKEIQESRSLININDSFKKIIVVKDHIMPRRNEEGILTIGLYDFLLKEDSLDLWNWKECQVIWVNFQTDKNALSSKQAQLLISNDGRAEDMEIIKIVINEYR